MKNWNTINIKQFNEIFDLKDMFHTDEDDLDLICRLIAVLEGTTYEDVLGWNHLKVLAAAKQLQFLNHRPIPRPAKRVYTLNGHNYVTTMDMMKITTAQYIDFQAVAPNYGEHIEDMLGIILIPEGKTYNNGYNFNDIKEDILTMGVEDALGLCAFFLHLYNRYTKRAIRQYEKLVRKLEKEEKKGRLNEEQKEAIAKVKEAMRIYKQVTKL